jgi:hypothetical protein
MALGLLKASVAVIDCMRSPTAGVPSVTLGLQVGHAPIATQSKCEFWLRAFRSMKQRQSAGSIQANRHNEKFVPKPNPTRFGPEHILA